MKWCQKKKIDCEKLFESTLVQKTPTGSIHLIFRQNPRYEIKQIIGFLDGVDIKGSDNNFIVIAPSVINGKKYAFDDPSKDPVVIPDDLACAIVSEHERVKRSNRRAIKNGGLTSDGLKYNQAFTKIRCLTCSTQSETVLVQSAHVTSTFSNGHRPCE